MNLINLRFRSLAILIIWIVGNGAGVVLAGEPIKSFGVSADGRRFMINGKAAFLAGFREGFVGGDWNPVYWNHTSPTGLPDKHPISPGLKQVDYSAYAAAIVDRGMNLARCTLIHMQAGHDRVHGGNERKNGPQNPPKPPFTERPWARTGGGKAWDGREKYNLNAWNDEYWSRLTEWVKTANANGIVVEVILFHQHNVYQLFTHYADNPLRPINCNLDTGLPNNFGKTAYPAYYGDNKVLRKVQEAYVDKTLDTIGRFPGVIYTIVDEYNWTDTWVEDWAARIKGWASAHGQRLVVQAGSSFSQLAKMNNDVQVANGTYFLQGVDGKFCDPPSLVEVRLAGFCKEKPNNKNIHATLVKMWKELPGKAAFRESVGADEPARKGCWGAFTGGAAGSFFHDGFDEHFEKQATLGTTALANMLKTFENMSPHDELASGGNVYVLANVGTEYVAYFPDGGRAKIDLSAATGSLQYKWYDPRICKLQDGGKITGGTTHTFTTPDDSDWVLWISAD